MGKNNQETSDFLEELNDLTAKYGIYIANLLDANGNTMDNPYLIPLDRTVIGAGYRLHSESGELIYDWS